MMMMIAFKLRMLNFCLVYCTSYISLCNKLPPKFSSLKQNSLFSLSFRNLSVAKLGGSGSGSLLRLQSNPQLVLQSSEGSTSTGGSTCEMAHSHGYAQKATVLVGGRLQFFAKWTSRKAECPQDLPAGFPRVKDASECKAEASEMTCPYFCHILLVRQTYPDTLWEVQFKAIITWGQGILRDHLGSLATTPIKMNTHTNAVKK